MDYEQMSKNCLREVVFYNYRLYIVYPILNSLKYIELQG